MVHQRNRQILTRSGFVGSFDTPYDPSDLGSKIRIRIFPKKHRYFAVLGSLWCILFPGSSSVACNSSHINAHNGGRFGEIMSTNRQFTCEELSLLNQKHNAHIAVRGKVRQMLYGAIAANIVKLSEYNILPSYLIQRCDPRLKFAGVIFLLFVFPPKFKFVLYFPLCNPKFLFAVGRSSFNNAYSNSITQIYISVY